MLHVYIVSHYDYLLAFQVISSDDDDDDDGDTNSDISHHDVLNNVRCGY